MERFSDHGSKRLERIASFHGMPRSWRRRQQIADRNRCSLRVHFAIDFADKCDWDRFVLRHLLAKDYSWPEVAGTGDDPGNTLVVGQVARAHTLVITDYHDRSWPYAGLNGIEIFGEIGKDDVPTVLHREAAAIDDDVPVKLTRGCAFTVDADAARALTPDPVSRARILTPDATGRGVRGHPVHTVEPTFPGFWVVGGQDRPVGPPCNGKSRCARAGGVENRGLTCSEARKPTA